MLRALLGILLSASVVICAVEHPLDALLEGYDKSQRPETQVNVTVNVYVRDIALNEITEQLETTLTFRMEWQDTRLVAHPTNVLPSTVSASDIASRIWIPDIFFAGEQEARYHDVFTRNIMIRLQPNGTVFFSTRISVKNLCKLDYRNYPFDRQVCNFSIESYSLTLQELALGWKTNKPITVNFKAQLRGYDLVNYEPLVDSVTTATGTYGKLIMRFEFIHNGKPAFYRFFAPTFILMILAHLAFYMPPSQSTGRLMLGLMGFLGTFIVRALSEELYSPPSALTAVDQWTLINTLFGAFILLESVLTNLMQPAASKDGEDEKTFGYSAIRSAWRSPLGTRMDLFSRILFPLLYAVANVAFWAMHFS